MLLYCVLMLMNRQDVAGRASRYDLLAWKKHPHTEVLMNIKLSCLLHDFLSLNVVIRSCLSSSGGLLKAGSTGDWCVLLQDFLTFCLSPRWLNEELFVPLTDVTWTPCSFFFCLHDLVYFLWTPASDSSSVFLLFMENVLHKLAIQTSFPKRTNWIIQPN